MILKQLDGCINSGYLVIDGKGFNNLTEEEKEDCWIRLTEALSERYSEETLKELLYFFISQFGNYNYMYTCEQCNDAVGEYTVEI